MRYRGVWAGLLGIAVLSPAATCGGKLEVGSPTGPVDAAADAPATTTDGGGPGFDATTREGGTADTTTGGFTTVDAYAASCADATTDSAADACVPVCTATVTSVLDLPNPYPVAVTIQYAMVGGGGGGGSFSQNGGGGGSSAILGDGKPVDIAAGGCGAMKSSLACTRPRGLGLIQSRVSGPTHRLCRRRGRRRWNRG